jgi:hypothetical protein
MTENNTDRRRQSDEDAQRRDIAELVAQLTPEQKLLLYLRLQQRIAVADLKVR